MRASDDSVPSERSVLERILIRSWEYRHLRFWAGYRIVAGIILVFCGVATLWVGAYGWAALFLVPAANVKYFFDVRKDEKNRYYSFDPKWYYEQIPDDEINKSHSLKQNPGY